MCLPARRRIFSNSAVRARNHPPEVDSLMTLFPKHEQSTAQSLSARVKAWVRKLKSDLIALWHCQRHPDMPLPTKILVICVVAYAFSPIDLIPDFIPVLGYLDDLIIVPLGIYFALRLTPSHVLESGRALAREWEAQHKDRPRNWIAAGVVAAVWAGVLYVCWQFARTRGWVIA